MSMIQRYLMERKHFGAPLAASLIIQQRLVKILGNGQAMTLVGWQICKLYKMGKMTSHQASLAKTWITSKAREIVALGRESLGANRILTGFLVAKAFCESLGANGILDYLFLECIVETDTCVFN
ncbi:hypothetical protein Dsin_022075 [Dipteronia sinensis]|uniref:Acyl-CoA dehydrogenase/oxidase C-terminal domain-containing protein n=1 Tax=Dipteronia sinensis TaxID=43782 RepID=A0AAE0A0V0_9ROSI|nr:hypothetical protein Dsin_022075 [Dipteronia sinensis]